MSSDGDIGEVPERFEISEAADHIFRSSKFKQASADFVRALADSIDDRGERNVEGLEPGRIKLHLVLPHKSANRGYLRHAGHGFQLVADVPVLKTAEIGEAHLVAVVNEDILIDPARACSVGSQHGINSRRQPTLQLLEILEHARTRPVQVCTILKDDVYVGVAEHGLGADVLHARGREHGRDNGISYLVLDNVWRFAGPWRVDDHLDIGNVGQRIERNVLHRPDSCENQQENCRENQEAVARAPVNQAADHVTSLLPRLRSIVWSR